MQNMRIQLALLVVTSSTWSCASFAQTPSQQSPAQKKETIHTCLLQIYEQRNLREAGTEYQALIALKPTDPNLHFKYGAYLEKGGDPKSVAEYKKATELNPRNPDYWGALGNAYYRGKNYSGAAGAYKHAVETGGGSKYGTMYQNMQQYLQQTQQYAKYQQQMKDRE